MGFCSYLWTFFTIWRGGEIFLNLDLQTPAKEEWEEEQLSCHSADLYTAS